MAKKKKLEENTPLTRSELYKQVFVNNREGALVLEDLCGLFHDKDPYVKGGPEGERETLRRLGMRSTVEFIINQCSKQIKPMKEEDQNDGSGTW